MIRFDLSRSFFILFLTLGTMFLGLGRYTLRRALHGAHRRGALLQKVVIAGAPDQIDEVAVILRRESWLGYQVIGALTPAQYMESETTIGIPVVGNVDEATHLASELGADVIFFAGGALKSAEHLRRMVWDLEEQHVQVVVAPSIADISSQRVKIRPVGGMPLVHIEKPKGARANRRTKRLFDVVGSSCLLLAFGPVLLIAALRIKLHDGGPVTFAQTRTGRKGREFSVLKLRTMVPDAEQRLAALQREIGHEEGLFKMADDPRITKPGRWLRRYSLDELPQLFNVLRGDMSLVGPRPALPHEVSRYDADTVRRLRVRPGMSGLWQVSGRSDLSWSEAIRLDLFYVDNWSMLRDLSILVRTIGAVFSSRGAY